MLLKSLLRADWRSGDLRLLLAALFLSVFVVTAFSAFSERLQILLVGQGQQFLAADQVLSSTKALDEAWIDQADDFDLQQARYLLFQSMLYVHDEPKLISVKAVDDAYPLRGQLQYRVQQGVTESAAHGPQVGEVWVDARLFALLDLQIGEQVAIGDADFIVAAGLIAEPDRGLSLFSLGPRVLMHYQDVPKTQAVQLGSRVHYRYLFAGDAGQLTKFREQLTPLLGDSQRWMDLDESQPTAAAIIEKAQLVFKLASSIIIILASIALAMASQRFSQRHQHQVAILKTLGLTSKAISKLYIQLLLLCAIPTALLAVSLAWLAQTLALQAVANHLALALPELSAMPFVLGVLTALISLAAFTLPALWQLKSTSALLILQKTQSAFRQFSLKSLLLLFFGLLILLRLYSQTWLFSVLLLVGLTALVLLLLVPSRALLKQLVKAPLPLVTQVGFALSNLRRHLHVHAIQLAIFSLSLGLLVLMLAVQHQLFAQWQKQMPEQAPNYFLINVSPQALPEIQQWMVDKQIKAETFYPMIQGRLSKINDQPVQDNFDQDELQKAGVNRELNLSWSDSLPDGNTVSEGAWLAGAAMDNKVSVEKKLADTLHIKLGDTLSFTIETQEVTAVVSSLRELTWDSMRPNFFVLLGKKQLGDFPTTYITSFWLAEQQRGEVNDLVKQWPTAILIDLDTVIRQIRQMVDYVGLAFQLVLFFVLLASLMVLVITVQASLAERQKENAILRALGTEKRLIRGSLLIEFALVGALAGVLASVIAQVVLLTLQAFVLNMPLQLQISLWPIAPIVGAVLVGAAGFFSARQVTQVSPLVLLRE